MRKTRRKIDIIVHTSLIGELKNNGNSSKGLGISFCRMKKQREFMFVNIYSHANVLQLLSVQHLRRQRPLLK